MGGGGAGALGKLGVALSVLFGLFLAVLLLEVLFLLFRGKSKNLRQQLQRELRGQHNQSHGPPPLPPPLYRRQRQRQQRQWRWRKQRRQQREQHGRINTTNNLPGRAESVHHASASAASSRHHFSREAALVGSFGGYPSSSSNANPPPPPPPPSSSSSAYPSSHSISSMASLFLADSLQFSPLHGALSSIAEETGAEVDLLPHNATRILTAANPNNPCAASACPNLRTGFADPNVYTAARSSKLDMSYLARSHNPSVSNVLLNVDQSPADPDSRINANNIRRESANPRECRDDLEMSGNPNVLSQAVGSPPDGGSGGRSPSAAVTVAVTPFTTPPSSPPPPPSSMTSSPVTAASHFSAVSVSPGSSSVPGSPMPSRLSVCSNGSVSVSLSVSVSGSTATSRFSPSESPVADHHHHGPLGALFRRTYNNIAASPSRPHLLPFRPVHYPASSVVVDFRRALPFSPPNSAAWNNNVS